MSESFSNVVTVLALHVVSSYFSATFQVSLGFYLSTTLPCKAYASAKVYQNLPFCFMLRCRVRSSWVLGESSVVATTDKLSPGPVLCACTDTARPAQKLSRTSLPGLGPLTPLLWTWATTSVRK